MTDFFKELDKLSDEELRLFDERFDSYIIKRLSPNRRDTSILCSWCLKNKVSFMFTNDEDNFYLEVHHKKSPKIFTGNNRDECSSKAITFYNIDISMIEDVFVDKNDDSFTINKLVKSEFCVKISRSFPLKKYLSNRLKNSKSV